MSKTNKRTNFELEDEIGKLVTDGGKSIKEIANLFNIDHNLVWKIKKRRKKFLEDYEITKLDNNLLGTGNKRCHYCNNIKNLKEFYTIGFKCKICQADKHKKQYLKKFESLESILAYRIKAGNNRVRVNDKFKENSLTVEEAIQQYHKQNGLCYYTGEILSFEPNNKNILSIDRLNPDIAYIKDNIVLCTAEVNIMKFGLQEKDFIDLCNKIINNFAKSN